MIYHLGILNLVLRFLSWWWHPKNFEPCHLKWEPLGHLGLWECWCCTSQVLDRHVQIWDHAASPAGSWFLIENWWDAYACILYLYDFMCIYQKYYQKYKYIIWRDAMQILGHHCWREMAWLYVDSPQNRRASKVSKRGFILIPALM